MKITIDKERGCWVKETTESQNGDERWKYDHSICTKYRTIDMYYMPMTPWEKIRFIWWEGLKERMKKSNRCSSCIHFMNIKFSFCTKTKKPVGWWSRKCELYEGRDK